jgi:Zn-finger nucleic acid-binding protein
MRVIVACPQCRRQYDATGRKPGMKFRCLCGGAVRIGRPRGHDASVVRCSSCGAPREKKSASCGHCGADFTVHERDLNTVCPACLARVSDRARYCHHCATALMAEALKVDQSTVKCPACEPRKRLSSRRLGGYPMAVLECPRCVGLWLGVSELDQLFEYESRTGNGPVVHAVLGESSSDRRAYRPCPVCDELMARRNFGGGKSGVVVDICGTHGIWFDSDELSQLVAWTRAGGLEEARLDLARLKSSRDVVRRRVNTDRERARRSLAAPRPTPRDDWSFERDLPADLPWVAALADVARRLMRRVR